MTNTWLTTRRISSMMPSRKWLHQRTSLRSGIRFLSAAQRCQAGTRAQASFSDISKAGIPAPTNNPATPGYLVWHRARPPAFMPITLQSEPPCSQTPTWGWWVSRKSAGWSKCLVTYRNINICIMIVLIFFSIVLQLFHSLFRNKRVNNSLHPLPVNSAPCQSLQSWSCRKWAIWFFGLRSIRIPTKDTAGVSDKGIKVTFTPVCFQHPGKTVSLHFLLICLANYL